MNANESNIDSLLWSLVFVAIGGAIMFAWNSELPAGLIWFGYIAALIGAGLLLRWWIGVVR